MEGLKVWETKFRLTKRNWQELRTSYGNTKTTKSEKENLKPKIGRITPNADYFPFARLMMR